MSAMLAIQGRRSHCVACNAQASRGTSWAATTSSCRHARACLRWRSPKRSVPLACRSSADEQQQVFGKPMANQEIWQGFRDASRQQLQTEMAAERGDPVMAALHVAAEDDAVTTKSTVALPVAAFSKRLDDLVARLKQQVAQDGEDLGDATHAVQYLHESLFGPGGFRVAPGSMDAFRPYRIYMHKVLTQRIGTQPALGALFASFVLRARQVGIVGDFDVQIRLSGGAQVPDARVAEADGDAEWCTGMQCVIACIEQLKRSNWCWPWEPAAAECFETPARAFLGEYGRAGSVSPAVGVLHTGGRPFGDLELALAACQKLAAVGPADENCRHAARNVRDQGVLLCHLKRYTEARQMLQAYEAKAGGREGGEEGALSREAEGELLRALMLKLDQHALEQAFSAS